MSCSEEHLVNNLESCPGGNVGVSIFPLGYRNLPFHFQVLRVNERFLNYPQRY